MQKSVAQVCTEVRDLIIRDGFTKGGGGWRGEGGWCIEGALAQVLGIKTDNNSELSSRVNVSEAGRALRLYLRSIDVPVWPGVPLHHWNDRTTKVDVLDALLKVAERAESVETPKAVLTGLIELLTWTGKTIAVSPVMASETAPDEEKVLAGV